MSGDNGDNVVLLDLARRLKQQHRGSAAPPCDRMAFTSQELEEIHEAFEKGRRSGVLSHYQVTNGEARARVDMYAGMNVPLAVITITKSRSGKLYEYSCEATNGLSRESVEGGHNFRPLLAAVRYHIDRLIENPVTPRPRARP